MTHNINEVHATRTPPQPRKLVGCYHWMGGTLDKVLSADGERILVVCSVCGWLDA